MRGLSGKSPLRAAGVMLGALLLVATGCRAIVGITDTSDLPGDDTRGDGGSSDAAPFGDATATGPIGDSSVGSPTDGAVPFDAPTLGDGGSVEWAQPASVCSPDGYCWYAPLPQGNDLHGTWTGSATDVWSVGAGGTVLHYDGSSWTGTSLGELLFKGCAGDSAGNVFAVGSSGAAVGALYKYSAAVGGAMAGWAPITSITRGLVTTVVPPPLYGVWSATGGNDTWIVGAAGTVINATDPGHFLLQSSGVTTDLFAVAGGVDGTVYMVGAHDVVLKFDPVSGEITAIDPPLMPPFVGANTFYEGAWVAPEGTLWVVGSGSVVLTYKAGVWSTVSTAGELITVLDSVTGDGAGHVWASGFTSADGGSTGIVGALDAVSATQSWTWTNLSTLGSLDSVSADPTGKVWAAGAGGRMARWNGAAWQTSPTLTDSNLNAVAPGPGPDASDLYAVGDDGVIAHFDGASWTLDPPYRSSLDAVWSSTNSTYLGGDSVLVELVNGLVLPGYEVQGTVTAIWGTGPTDIYATVVNAAQTPPSQLLHSTGASWEPLAVAPGNVMLGVTGTPETGAILYGATGSCVPGGTCTPGSGWLANGGVSTGFVSYTEAQENAFLTGSASGETAFFVSDTRVSEFIVGPAGATAQGDVTLPDGGLQASFTAVVTSATDTVAVATQARAFESDGAATSVKNENSGFASPLAVTMANGATWVVGASGSIVRHVNAN